MFDSDFDFDGVFRFTNATKEDFTAMWDNVAYTFPAMKTSPMIIAGATPEEVQNIRKKFARELAEREFYKTKKFKSMEKMGNGLPPLYHESDLADIIQSCLAPLPSAKAVAKPLPKDDGSKYIASKAVKDKDNLNFVFKDDVPQDAN